MTEKDIEKKLNDAVSKAVPDVLGSILEECRSEKGKVMLVNTETKKKKISFKKIVSIAAALTLVAGLAFGVTLYNKNNAVDSVILFDVNPSIELDVNKNERVLSVTANNAEAKTVIGDMDFKGSDLDLAVNAIIGSMLRHGFIDELSNSILISVDNEDPEKSSALQKKLSEEVNKLLSGSFEAAVLSQTLSHTPEDERLAKEYDISEGKAQLISGIINADSRYTFETLAPLSINELNLLLAPTGDTQGKILYVGSASDKGYIGREKAIASAYEYSGVSADSVEYTECEFDYDDGLMLYEVEFHSGDTEYEIDVDAKSGTVIKCDKEKKDVYIDRPNGNEGSSDAYTGEYIGEEKAKEIALTHAGVSLTETRDFSAELDKDDGRMVYEVDFESGRYEYSYKIDAHNGEIIKSEKDIED
ncbi:MAG: cell wall protein [Ruminococcaceae bacterium]|nr:cell wall protein [Oscillospiraceae bacterium]